MGGTSRACGLVMRAGQQMGRAPLSVRAREKRVLRSPPFCAIIIDAAVARLARRREGPVAQG